MYLSTIRKITVIFSEQICKLNAPFTLTLLVAALR